MRDLETKRSDEEGRLFSDPFAGALAGEFGIGLMERAIAEVGEQPAIAIRTAFFDEKIINALNIGVRQIVMLAAGMDSRAYRINFPAGTTLFELDQPEVLAYKNAKLDNIQPQCNRIEIALDLREEWQGQLIDAGFKRQHKTLWIIEGLLMYLEEEQVITLFERINSLASPNDLALFDIFNRHLLESPFMQTQLNFLKSLGAPWKFGTNDPEKFMKELGWSIQLSQAGEYAPTRWPFPVAPRHIPNMPRGFFAEGLKI